MPGTSRGRLRTCRELNSVRNTNMGYDQQESNKVWACFETDELGRPLQKLAGSKQALLGFTIPLPANVFESSAQGLASANVHYLSTNIPDLPTQPMIQNWGASDFLRKQWQKYINQALCDEGHTCKQCSKIKNSQVDNVGTCNDKFGFPLSYEAEEGLVDTSDKDGDMSLSTYRLHVENSDRGNSYPDLNFAAPLDLTRSLIEQKLNCSGKDLHGICFLNLNHEGLSSLGNGIMSSWCPKTRVFTADMNRLSHLDGAFTGYEGTLEQLSLKDNFLCDLGGLEGLHNLQVMHLDGNSIFEVVASHCSLLPRDEKFKNVCEQQWPGTDDGHRIILPRGDTKCLPMNCWPYLKELGLSCNRISRVERLGCLCPDLEVLDLGSNYLGSLGTAQKCALAGLKSLRVLDIGQNRLKGRSLWEALSHCPLLVSLVASRNRLEELPTHGGSVLLRELWLNGNAIKHFSCTAWMPSLQRLYLQDNEISTITPIWGLPALQVLDLSFNRISHVHELKLLGCFANLRSLQLNDNPVSELPHYVDLVLEAVPWFVELDNEALTESARHYAIKNIFLKTMNAVGILYLQFITHKGKVPFFMIVDIFKQQMMETQCIDVKRLTKQQNIGLKKVTGTKIEKHQISINKIMDGDVDIPVLWAIILEISQMWYNHHRRPAALRDPLMSYQLETEWRMQSFQLMCFYHKQRVVSGVTGLKQSRKVIFSPLWFKPPEEDCKEGSPKTMQVGYSNGSKKGQKLDPDVCFLEHVQFDDNQYKDYFQINEQYNKEMCIWLHYIIKLQALLRGLLARKHLSFLREVKMQGQKGEIDSLIARLQAYWKGIKLRKSGILMELYSEREKRLRAIIRVQALWRGFKTRKRFHLAVKNSRYEDDEDDNYIPFDEGMLQKIEVGYEEFSMADELCLENMLNQHVEDGGKDDKENRHEDKIGISKLLLSQQGLNMKYVRSKDYLPSMSMHIDMESNLLEQGVSAEKGVHT